MKKSLRLMAFLMTLVLLVQAIPAAALAETGTALSASELDSLLAFAGLRTETTDSGRIALEAEESAYHAGMTPDDTWNARMLTDWLQDRKNKDFYSDSSSYARALTILTNLETENPLNHARLTGDNNQKYVNLCRNFAQRAEETEQQANFLITRMNENTVLIEQLASILLNDSGNLFEYDKLRYAQQLRNAKEEMGRLSKEVLALSGSQTIGMGRNLLAERDDGFNAWFEELTSMVDGPEKKTASVVKEDPAANTLMARLSPVSRALAEDKVNEANILVLSKQQFAIVIQDKDNHGVEGVSVTVTDLNSPDSSNPITKTLTTVKQGENEDSIVAAIFSCSDFICDFEQEMELEIVADGSAQGYRSFYIPWTLMKQGGHRTEILTKLTEPASGAEGSGGGFAGSDEKDAIVPYAYSATFNNMDILRTDKIIRISDLNDNSFSFVLEVDNPDRLSYHTPEFHYWVHEGTSASLEPIEKIMRPSSTESIPGTTRTRYTYTAKWKQKLSPDIKKEQRPYFYFPDRKIKVQTLAQPVRSVIEKPAIADMGVDSPLQKVFGEGLGLMFDIPSIGGRVDLDIPMKGYLPKIRTDGMSYITVTFGSSVVDKLVPKSDWKNQEQERYDKGMRQFEHETNWAGMKQKLGTASKYYKYMAEARQNMRKASFDLGWFLILSGRKEGKDEDDQSEGWSAGGTAGLTVTLGFSLTQPMALGPIPFYVNVNIAGSMGFGGGISYRLLKYKNGEEVHAFDLTVTIEFRLALSVSLGIGVKGIASVWVAATGTFDIMLSFVSYQPVHVSVTFGAAISVGFEFFFISYSNVVYNFPTAVIYQNGGKGFRLPFGIVSALADPAPGNEAETTKYTPDRYPELAPEAQYVYYKWPNMMNLTPKVLLAKAGGTEFAFSIMKNQNGTRLWRMNLQHPSQCSPHTEFLEDYTDKGLLDFEPYDFDVISDGTDVHMIILAARSGSFGEDNLPRRGSEIKVLYCKMGEDSYSPMMVYDWPRDPETQKQWCLSSMCSDPHFESLIQGENGKTALYGSMKGVDNGASSTQYILFRIEPEGDTRQPGATGEYLGNFICIGDSAAGGFYNGADYRRTQFRSAIMNMSDNAVWAGNLPCGSFVALDSDRSESGKSHLIAYDNYSAVMIFPDSEPVEADEYGVRTPANVKREVIDLAEGNIGGFALLQTLAEDRKSYSQTIFYTLEETVGERSENRLKGIHIGPRDYSYISMDWNVTYTDYDLTIPTVDLNAVTIGVSQYLYWLSTVPKQQESDPDMWRISGVYYDSSINTLSDELTIAEFSLPKINGKRAVPHQVTLTDRGIGYITVSEESGSEKGVTGGVDIIIYRFPITLKAAGSLRGAALTENVVNPGDNIATDLTLMNEGNMGIGSFVVDVMSVEKGQEKLVETLYANCFYPDDSRIVMADGRTASSGEKAFYRYKDFIYAPKKHEWLISQKRKRFSINEYSDKIYTKDDPEGDSSSYIETNVLVPGALGGYGTNIKIPENWIGSYHLRLKLRELSTFGDWLHASALAQQYPELFAFYSDDAPLKAAQSEARLMALAGGEEKQAGLRRLVYTLDENSGMLTLQNPEKHMLYDAMAEIQGEAYGEKVRLYPQTLSAPQPVNLEIKVNDIDVGHRLYMDYYGNEMLEITVHNYYQSSEPIRLYCMIYEDDSRAGRNFALPHELEYVSAGKTQTITLPLSSMVDIDKHEKIRVVIKGVGLTDETATFNNEFTVYLGGTISPEPTPAPKPLPPTGDSASPVLWIALMVIGLAVLGAMAYLNGTRKKKEK